MFLSLRKIPSFRLNSWCKSFVERHIFHVVSAELPKTMRKLCLSTKFPYQEIGEIMVLFTVCDDENDGVKGTAKRKYFSDHSIQLSYLQRSLVCFFFHLKHKASLL